MRILMVCQYYYPEQFRINDICEHMVKDGHQVTVLTGLPNYPGGTVPKEYRWFRRRTETINGVRVVRCFEIGRGKGNMRLGLNYLSYMISASFRSLFLGNRYDLVMVNQLSPVTMAIPAIVYKKLYRKKLFLYCLDLWPDSLAAGGIAKDSRVYELTLKLSRWIYKKADRIAVTSKSFIEYFDKVLRVPGTNIVYLPQYAEDIFSPSESSQLPDKNTNIVFAGNIGEMQSPETIILAANELKQRTDIHFHIIGGGSMLSKCQDLVKKLELTNITFYGQRPLSEMPGFYSMADAMLITLKKNEFISYTLPGKIQTYMAAGKVILGAINGETRRIIEEAQCGLCCESEDHRSYAKMIENFADYLEDHYLFSENSFKYYEQHFSEDAFFDNLYRNLEELISQIVHCSEVTETIYRGTPWRI